MRIVPARLQPGRGAAHRATASTAAVAGRNSFVRHALRLLLAVGALNALGGGLYGLSGAPHIPKQWLAGSPFSDYFIPSLFLFVVVGGICLLAALAVTARWRNARGVALAAAWVVLAWIATQVSIIGFVSWLQPATALAGAAILALAAQLPRR